MASDGFAFSAAGVGRRRRSSRRCRRFDDRLSGRFGRPLLLRVGLPFDCTTRGSFGGRPNADGASSATRRTSGFGAGCAAAGWLLPGGGA